MQTLLNLLAGVSLLVWGTHIVRTGILRLYGGDLRRILRRSVARSRFAAFAAGIGKRGRALRTEWDDRDEAIVEVPGDHASLSPEVGRT